MSEKQINIYPETSFFPIFQKVIKSVKYPKDQITIRIQNNDQYRFKFDWQNEDICGIDVFEVV